MSFVWVFLFFLTSFQLHAIDSALQTRCLLALIGEAKRAHETNYEMAARYFRSPLFIDPSKDPTDFWLLSERKSGEFFEGAAARIEKAADMAPHYEQALAALSDRPVTAQTARQIAELESDSFFNAIVDEYEALAEFDPYARSQLKPSAYRDYIKVKNALGETVGEVLKLRNQLRLRLSPERLNSAERKLLLDAWAQLDYASDFHPDTLPDWVTGADAALTEDRIFMDPRSGHQIGYGTTPLAVVKKTLADIPLQSGDTVLDVGSGWGRIVMGGAITHPQFNFTGVEFVGKRADYVQQQISKLEISNAKSSQGDASAASIEKDIAQAKVLFLFNSFSKPALELFLERVKKVAQSTGQKKYLVTINEQGFPFSLVEKGFKVYKKSSETNENKYNSYIIYEIGP